MIADTISYSRQRLAAFEQAHSSDAALCAAYGMSEQSAERAQIEKELDTLVCMVELWGQPACFGSDWFKFTLVELGALDLTLDLLFTLKLMVDQLDKMTIFEQWKLRREEPEASAPYFEGAAGATTEEVKEEAENPG